MSVVDPLGAGLVADVGVDESFESPVRSEGFADDGVDVTVAAFD